MFINSSEVSIPKSIRWTEKFLRKATTFFRQKEENVFIGKETVKKFYESIQWLTRVLVEWNYFYSSNVLKNQLQDKQSGFFFFFFLTVGTLFLKIMTPRKKFFDWKQMDQREINCLISFSVYIWFTKRSSPSLGEYPYKVTINGSAKVIVLSIKPNMDKNS